MKKNRAFTIVELVIVIAVASILFAIIAGLSVITRGIVVSQRATTKSIQEYQDVKLKIESFLSGYSFDYYGIETPNENQIEIYLSSEIDSVDKVCQSKIVFDTENKKLIFYKLVDDTLLEDNSTDFLQITNIVFVINEDACLLKCKFTFEEYNDYEFLINLGGLEIGNLY